jgi:hypothetical protein
MSPSPSPSPPPPSIASRPLRASSRQHPSQAPPPPVQPSTASIYSASHHEDDPNAAEDTEADDYPPVDPQDEAASLLPPPNFRPLFTVITDPQTRETYHPSVYYVFSDDAENERGGNDVATVAALRALDQAAQKTQKQYEKRSNEEDEVEERFVIIDLEPAADPSGTALKVKNISSLSPSWAVTSTTLRNAPTFEDETEEGSESLMLQIEGLELAEPAPSSFSEGRHGARIKKEDAERKAANLLQEARKRGGGDVVQGMEEIWKGLNEGLGVLERVLGEEHSGSK